ncbi:MAG: hypothetical protein M1813_008684 [Trichoglossum hirsutum]|nr:MAG: hypothetical protein M1813_008684 [Trichoglossum hirsutum]
MAVPSLALNQQSSLQKEAIENARLVFSRLPSGDATFRQCIDQADTILDVVKTVTQKCQSHRRKKLTRLLEGFQRYSLWLQNMSGVVDVVVQTQAGIGCPVWAPIKFVLQVSKDHYQAAEHILNLIRTISDSLPRFHIYEKLQPDPILQVALLNIFTDVVEFSVLAIQYFGRSVLVRFAKLFVRPFEEEFGDILVRLERHSKIVDRTAVATELLRADEFRKEARTKDQQTLKIECRRLLKPSNIRDTHQHQLRTRLQGTCDWIWVNPTFVEWNEQLSISASDRLLCIYGTHGCGKTVLASSIVDRLESKRQQTLFFPFSITANRQGLDALVRTFLWQLLQESSDQEGLEIVQDLMQGGPPSLSDLWDTFNRVAELVARPVYCVIDGVDECDDSTQILSNRILELLAAHSNFRAVLLGRSHALQSATGTTQKIEVTPKLINRDIDAFIGAEIDESEVLRLPELRDPVFKSLQEKSDGMFLWVKLMIDDLRKSATLFEVTERLSGLPRGLEEAYRHRFLRLVRELDHFQLSLARKVLTFTIVSFRPLELEELQYALAIGSGGCSAFRNHLLLQPAQQIRGACGDLVNITNGLVQLSHFSIKEFLTRPENSWHCDDHKIRGFRVDLEAAHGSFGSACVDYLRMGEYGFPLHDSDAFIALGSRYPLLRYASRYMISHLGRSTASCSTAIDKVKDFLDSARGISWIEYLVMLLVDDGSFNIVEGELRVFGSLLNEGGYVWKDRVLTSLRQELANRTRKFGGNDLRTEQCQNLLNLVEQMELDLSPRIANKNVTLNATLGESSAAVSQIMDLLNSGTALPLHRQVDMILRLQSHLLKARILTDPLKKLFRIILQRAPIIPVYVLLAIGTFYRRLGKSEEALEVYRAALAKMENRDVPIKITILASIAHVLDDQERYEEAEAMYRQTLEAGERLLGREHADTLSSAYWLGTVLIDEGKYEEAETIHRQTLEARERVLGKAHEDTLWSASQLGTALYNQGKYEEAGVIHRQALEARERVLGKEHEDTLWSASELGIALHYQGKYEEAGVIHRQALEARERVLGKEHEDTLRNASQLGFTLINQGKYREAEAIHRQTLEARERVLGKGHKDTLWSASELGTALYNQGKYEEAEVIHRQTLEARERALGKEHEDTLWSASQLGFTLINQGKYREAEAIHRQTLEARERVLGKGHKDTLWSASELGIALHGQEKLREAEAIHRQTLEAREMVLGKEHADTLSSAYSLGVVLIDEGEYEEAEIIHRQILEARERVLGKEHKDTLQSFYHLGVALNNQGKYREAEAVHRQTLEARERVLGKEHKYTLRSASHVGIALHNQGKYEEARVMHRRTLEARERALGKEHEDTLSSACSLGEVLRDQGKYEEAEATYRPILEAREKTLGNEHADTLWVASELESVLRNQGKLEEADAVYERTQGWSEDTCSEEA